MGDNEVYPVTGIYVTGLAEDSEEEAWTSFDLRLKYYLFWLKGYKYWRAVPQVRHQLACVGGKDTFTGIARIIVSVNPFKELLEVTTNKPYPNKLPKDGEYQNNSFGYVPKGKL